MSEVQDYLRLCKLCNEAADLFEKCGHLSMAGVLRHMAQEMKPKVDQAH